jgi:hypothetical protein
MSAFCLTNLELTAMLLSNVDVTQCAARVFETAGHVFDDVALLVAGIVIIVWNQKRREFQVYLECDSFHNFSVKYCNYSVKYIV